MVERRNDKIADLEYEIYSWQEAIDLRYGVPEKSPVMSNFLLENTD